LDVRIKGGRFDGFGDQDGVGINSVFGKRFIGRGREKVKKFRFIVEGVHDNKGITFIKYKDNDFIVVVKAMNSKNIFFR
jgi:hypothetical protein